jgi:hypothetical protein
MLDILIAKASVVVEEIEMITRPYPQDEDLWQLMGEYKSLKLQRAAKELKDTIAQIPEAAETNLCKLVLCPHTAPFRDAVRDFRGWVELSKSKLKNQRREELDRLH